MAGFRALSGAPVAIFRCDASPRIGAGHVMRCLALAEELGDIGWCVRFVVGNETISTVPPLARRGVGVRVLHNADELEVLREEASGQAELLVVDHYQRDATFEHACRTFVKKILVLDDATGRNHDCDFLVDAAASGPDAYAGNVPASARVMAGPAYALLRRSFLAHRETALARRDGRSVKEILVSCGATDPDNVTAAVLDGLDDLAGEIPTTVVLSSRAPHIDAVRKRLRGKAQLLLDVEDMAELMTNADLAIGAAGSTAYERAVLGLPSILVTVAENQREIAGLMTGAKAAADGGAVDSGLSIRLRELTADLLKDGAARRNMAAAASALVDGRGAVRIALAMLDDVLAKNGARIRLQLASTNDERWLLKIQQHPQTRRHFRNAAIPTAEEHHEWMRRVLADPERLLLAVTANERPVGSIRLDQLSQESNSARYEVSIAIDPECQGIGIGTAALRLVRAVMPGAVLDATVFPDNKASCALFAGAGFAAVSGDVYRSIPHRVLS
jgi:UDP-2,4-diacetamido-2,4,6-trideoxy-beta-L-altropyranose hydrolase